jgi:signal transduction histidine kinase
MEERARLARELHDSVTQALFSMTLHARTAQIMLDQEERAIRDRFGRPLRELGELTRAALAEMRALLFELRPGALSEEGLVAALRKQGAAVSAREGLRVDVQTPDNRVTLDPAGEEHLYRVSQEALHNAVKHARATEVQIRLWTEDDTVLVEVRDDGVGFDVAAVPPGHLGLRTMAERMAQIGGTVEIVSAPGSGTTVRASYRSRRSPSHPLVSPILQAAPSASTSPALNEPLQPHVDQ